MKLSHADANKDLIKSKDAGDYYAKCVAGIHKDIKQALEILNPYNGHMFYEDRLSGCSALLTQIAMHLEELAEEF